MTKKTNAAPTMKDVAAEAGVALGTRFGTRFRKQAGIAGGAILVLIGVKILLEHTGVL